MSLKEKINTDFIIAMKAKALVVKSALSSVKAKITEGEKLNGNSELSDQEVLKVITTAIKQRKQSYDAFILGGREDLAIKEQEEMKVLEIYLPKQMTEEEIESAVTTIVQEMSAIGLVNSQALIGKTIGEFNKQYQGMADITLVKSIVNKLINQ
jgi:uncharacterized protein YqeY